jgi:O-antigen/teichoic acid export membrane protein
MGADRPSRAVERTALGWQRSGLSLAVIAALLLLHAVHEDEPWGIVAGFAVSAGAALVAMAGRRLYRRRLVDPRGPAARPLRGLVVITLLAAVLAAAEIVGGR